MTNKQQPKVFRTKEAFCHVFPDYILFSKKPDSVQLDLGKSDTDGCVMAVFVFPTVFLYWLAWGKFESASYFWGTIWLLGAIFLTFCTFLQYKSKDANVVRRSDIVSVELVKYSSIYKSGYVDLKFRYGNKVKEMRVELIGSIKSGDPDARNAVRILTEEGYLVQDGIAKSGMTYEMLKIQFQQRLVDFCEQRPYFFESSEIGEIEEGEKEMQIMFPKSYLEYLTVAGDVNKLNTAELEFFTLSKMNARNKELRKKARQLNTDFGVDVPFVTFAFHENRYVYFRLDAGPDPRVYEILTDGDPDTATLGEPQLVSPSLSDYVAETLPTK